MLKTKRNRLIRSALIFLLAAMLLSMPCAACAETAVPLYEEKAGMTPLFYEYVQQNHESSYDVPWSVWLEEQEAQLSAA